MFAASALYANPRSCYDMRAGVAGSVAATLPVDTCWHWAMKAVEAHCQLMRKDARSPGARQVKTLFQKEIDVVDVADAREIRVWWADMIARAYDGAVGWDDALPDVPAAVMAWADDLLKVESQHRQPRPTSVDGDDDDADDKASDGKPDDSETADDDSAGKPKKPRSKPKKTAKKVKQASQAKKKGALACSCSLSMQQWCTAMWCLFNTGAVCSGSLLPRRRAWPAGANRIWNGPCAGVYDRRDDDHSQGGPQRQSVGSQRRG